MRRFLAALVAGALFGSGLVVSQMMDPEKVLGFLDLAGDWDPSLAFVMAGAIPAAFLGFILSRRTGRPWLASGFAEPARRSIDRRLIAGAAMFGVGWGLVGYCPGPALASVGNGTMKTAVFVLAMGIGMAAFQWLAGQRAR